MKLKEIATSEDRAQWAQIYTEWLRGKDGELILSEAGKALLNKTVEELSSVAMPLTSLGALGPDAFAFSTLTRALDWDKRMNHTGMLDTDTTLAKQLTLKSFNAAAETWDKKVKTAAPVFKVTSSSDFTAAPGAPKSGRTEELKHTLEPSDFSGSLVEAVPCELHVPQTMKGLFEQVDEGHLQARMAQQNISWMFTCSYNRASSACLDREKAMSPLTSPHDYVQVLVVRKGQVEAYKSQCGGCYVIAALPEKMQFQYEQDEPLDLDVTAGGIGYARLFCQLLAHSLGLHQIWMLDDNVRRCYELDLDGVGRPTLDEHELVKLTACSFTTVMQGIEKITRDGDQSTVDNPALGNPATWFEANRLSATFAPLHPGTPFRPNAQGSPGTITSLQHYTGSASQYGVIGMQRDIIKQERGFKVTHSVYSFFLLNVASTVGSKCFYPAKPIWEDIEFLHMLDEANLAVCKVSKYVHRKAHSRKKGDMPREPKPPVPPKPLPPPLQPTLEEYLAQASPFDSNNIKSFLGSSVLVWVDEYDWFDADGPMHLLLASANTWSSQATTALLPLRVPRDPTLPDEPVRFSDILRDIRIWNHRLMNKCFNEVVLLVQHLDVMEDELVPAGVQPGELVRNVMGLTRETIQTMGGAFERMDGFEQGERFVYETKQFFAIRLPLAKGANRTPDGKATGSGAGSKHKAQPGSSSDANDERPSKAPKTLPF